MGKDGRVDARARREERGREGRRERGATAGKSTKPYIIGLAKTFEVF